MPVHPKCWHTQTRSCTAVRFLQLRERLRTDLWQLPSLLGFQTWDLGFRFLQNGEEEKLSHVALFGCPLLTVTRKMKSRSRENKGKGKGKSYAEVYADFQPCESRMRELTRIPGAIRCLSEIRARDLHRSVGDSRLRPGQKGTALRQILCGAK